MPLCLGWKERRRTSRTGFTVWQGRARRALADVFSWVLQNVRPGGASDSKRFLSEQGVKVLDWAARLSAGARKSCKQSGRASEAAAAAGIFLFTRERMT